MPLKMASTFIAVYWKFLNGGQAWMLRIVMDRLDSFVLMTIDFAGIRFVYW